MNAADMDGLLRAAGPERAPDEAPPYVLARIEETLQTLPDRRGMRALARRRRLGFATAAIVLATLVLMLSAPRVPQLAESLGRLPATGAAFFHPNNWSQTTARGIVVTIGKVEYDGYMLAAEYRIVAERPADWDEQTMSLALNADGAEILKLTDVPLSTANALHAEDDVYEGRLEGALPEAYPQSFNLRVAFAQIAGRTGDWTFDIPVKKIPGATSPQSVLVTNDWGTLQIIRVTTTPLTTRIDYRILPSESAQSKETTGSPMLQVADDRGNVLSFDRKQMSGHVDENGAYDSLIVPAPPAGAKRLKFSVAIQDRQAADADMPIYTNIDAPPAAGAPVKLQQGEAGYVEIREIRYFADRTEVDYRIVGSNPERQFIFFLLDAGGKERERLPYSIDKPGLDVQTRIFEPVKAGLPLTFQTRDTLALAPVPGLATEIELAE